MNTVEIDHSESAEVFLEAIAKPQLKASHGHSKWLFRGHADARWPLVPVAFREQAKRILESRLGHSIVTREDQIRAEYRCLEAFFQQTDDAGLTLPGDCISMRRHFESVWKEIHRSPVGPIWIDEEFWPWVALAQHYGLPTRLLDWSKSPEKAAYFSAAEAGAWLFEKREPAGWERLAVWAFSINSLDFNPFGCGTVFTSRIPVTLVRVPRASNPNLHAQDGVLTLTTEMDARISAPIEPDCLTNLFAKRLAVDEQPNLFTCFTLPKSQAPALLSLLAEREIHAGTMFPSYHGTVRAVFEQTWRK